MLDYAVSCGLETLFFELIKKPRALEVIQRPQHFYRKSNITAVLQLTSHAHDFNENVNQEFIADSFLYLAIRSRFCRVRIVQQLILLGCPLMNPALPLDQHDFHPLFTLLRRPPKWSIGPSWYYHAKPLDFTSQEGATLAELGAALLAKQDPVCDREVAIGIDVSLDGAHHRETPEALRRSYLPHARTHPELLRLVLPTGRLFGSLYTFEPGRIAFWTAKTLKLLFHETQLGLSPELRQTIAQLHAFILPSQIPDRVAEIATEEARTTTGLAASRVLNTLKFHCQGNKKEVLNHAEALRTLLLGVCFLRLDQARQLSWLFSAVGKVCGTAELFLRGKDRLPLVALKDFFQAFKAFHRHSCTTLLHYLAKYSSLAPDLTTALQGSAHLYAKCLDRKGRSPLTIAARSANLKAAELLLQAGASLQPGDLYIALQGPAHTLTQPLSHEEETSRIQVFVRLLTHVSGSGAVVEDLSGYDELFAQEKTWMQGSEKSLGYPLILACSRFSEAGVRQLLALGLSPCLLHVQKLPKKVRKSGRIQLTSQYVPTCALKEALKRKDCTLSLVIFHELAAKYPLTFSKQRYFSLRAVYGECAVLAQRLDLLEVAEGIRKNLV